MTGRKFQSVCVFAGSSFGARPSYAAAAQSLGGGLASRGMTLVYGGAAVGLMGAVADAALAVGGRVIGVLPRALADLELAHKGLSELRIVESMHERKLVMSDASEAFIALPGGLGTFEELLEVWTWLQLGIHAKPVGLLNVEGYFTKLFDFLDHGVAEGFIKSKHRTMGVISQTVDGLLEIMGEVDVSYDAKWIGKPGR